MKRIFILACMLLPFVACGPKEDLSQRALELCKYIPDHELNPEAKEFMTPEFYAALEEAFDAPVVDYLEIGDDEWLNYFVTGNGGSTPAYSVKSVTKTSKNTATAVINVKDIWEEGAEPVGEGADYEISLVRVNRKWLLDDFDNKKAECIDYVDLMRSKYKSGELTEWMLTDDDLTEYLPDFQQRVAEFYKKHGE